MCDCWAGPAFSMTSPARRFTPFSRSSCWDSAARGRCSGFSKAWLTQLPVCLSCGLEHGQTAWASARSLSSSVMRWPDFRDLVLDSRLRFLKSLEFDCWIALARVCAPLLAMHSSQNRRLNPSADMHSGFTAQWITLVLQLALFWQPLFSGSCQMDSGL